MRLLNDTQKREVTELENASLPATRDKIAAAIAGHAYEFSELSPEGGLGTLTTPVYLLLGEADNVIPAAETLWMASELPRNDLKAMLVSPVLSHVDLETEPDMMEEWRLVRFFGLVMHAAETPGGREARTIGRVTSLLICLVLAEVEAGADGVAEGPAAVGEDVIERVVVDDVHLPTNADVLVEGEFAATAGAI